MPDVHLWMLLVPFVAAVWWTKNWFMNNIISKWRLAISALVSVILWVFLAYQSTRVVVPEGGQEYVYGSTALAYVCVFMALLSVLGFILALVTWTEEEAQRASQELPDSVRPDDFR